MRARVTIEYEMIWPSGPTAPKLREREAERWMTNETVVGLRMATSRSIWLMHRDRGSPKSCRDLPALANTGSDKLGPAPVGQTRFRTRSAARSWNDDTLAAPPGDLF